MPSMKFEPLTLWFTGLSGAGKTTLAGRVQQALSQTQPCFLLDGDELRQSLSKDLGFSPSDRAENVRRAAAVSRMLNDQGILVCVALISPHAVHRAEAARVIGPARFREIYLSASLAVCEARDVKGLYKKARAGALGGLTGIDGDYDVPLAPWMIIDTSAEAPLESCDRILARLAQSRRGIMQSA